jgi:hypothetical protein
MGDVFEAGSRVEIMGILGGKMRPTNRLKSDRHQQHRQGATVTVRDPELGHTRCFGAVLLQAAASKITTSGLLEVIDIYLGKICR